MPAKTSKAGVWASCLRFSAEEAIIAGIGVLLFFLGLWVGAVTTKVFSLLIALIAFYYLVTMKWSKIKEALSSSPVELSPQIVVVEREEDVTDWQEELPDNEVFEGFRIVRKLESSVPEKIEQEHDAGEVAHSEPAPRHHQTVEYQVTDFVDIDAGHHAAAHRDPKGELTYLLGKLLFVVKEMMFAHSVSLYWVKRETGELLLDIKETDSQSFSPHRKFPLSSDLLSRVALSGKPEIISGIAANAERDMVPYYTRIQGIKSLVVVPIFYPEKSATHEPIAVLAIDSTADDAFGPESLKMLGGMTKTISAMLLSLTEKYDLLSDAGILKAEQRMRQKIPVEATIPAVVNALAEEVAGLFSWDIITVVLFDESMKQWTVANLRMRVNDRYVAAKQIIDFHGSIAGMAIKQNVAQIIGDLSSQQAYRFVADESAWGAPVAHAFLAVPLSSPTKCYGVMTLECRDTGIYGSKEAEQVRHLGSVAAMLFDSIEAHDVIREYVAVDETTGVFSKKFLVQRLSEELSRMEDSETAFSFLLIAIAGYEELGQRYGKNGAIAALERVSAILRSCVRKYDVVGRYGAATFGILLSGVPSNDAFLWAEKIRSTVASSVITFDQKSFSVTITIGVCGTSAGMSKDDCLSYTEQVLQKAIEAGGNMVRVL
jgi:diguanylate cyclase (GGDEF)-like protein